MLQDSGFIFRYKGLDISPAAAARGTHDHPAVAGDLDGDGAAAAVNDLIRKRMVHKHYICRADQLFTE